MNARVLFSVVVPTYNRASLIVETIQSLLNQNFESFEIIIVDDGSSDNTKEIIQNNFSDQKKLRYFQKENGERGAARNFGASQASGKYLNFFDSDDIALKIHLEEANNVLNRVKDPAFFHLNYYLKKGDLDPLICQHNFNDFQNLIVNGNPLSCNGVFIRKDVFEQNKFSEDRSISASEDYLLWLRLFSRYPFHFSNIPTSIIVEHEERSVNNINKQGLIERKEKMLKYALQDKFIVEKIGGKINLLKSNTYSYISLHLALIFERKAALNYFFKAVRWRPLFVFTKRSLAILKRLFFRSKPSGF